MTPQPYGKPLVSPLLHCYSIPTYPRALAYLCIENLKPYLSTQADKLKSYAKGLSCIP
jgi:hypothetical protein